jgi:hypothetical protein
MRLTIVEFKSDILACVRIVRGQMRRDNLVMADKVDGRWRLRDGMDIHDRMVKVIDSELKYIEKNI